MSGKLSLEDDIFAVACFEAVDDCLSAPCLHGGQSVFISNHHVHPFFSFVFKYANQGLIKISGT